MLLRSLHLTGVLSFGPLAEPVPLRALNVLIGPNGSGKSNFLEAIALLKEVPRDLAPPIRDGGGIGEWIWKGYGGGNGAGAANGSGYGGGSGAGAGDGYGSGYGSGAVATLAAVLAFQGKAGAESGLRHRLSLAQAGQSFEVLDERLESEGSGVGTRKPFLYFGYENGRPILNLTNRRVRALRRESLHPQRSILAQFKDPEKHPELGFVSQAYAEIALYRDWTFGRTSPSRVPQHADLPTDHLLENGRNLGLILNRYRLEPSTKRSLIEAMCEVFGGIVDFSVKVEGGTVQIFLEERGGWSTPATRLSDGTMRWLSLLAVLLDPKPPRLVCIEEPELGLHPDVIPTLAKLLRSASERMQLVVTTHSEVLVDALSESPEDIVVCERHDGSTTMNRLDKANLALWLKDYRLGQLWSKGVLGGNRW